MRIIRACIRSAVCCLGLGAATFSTSAATLTVTSTADGGAGSLRAALAAAANGDTIDATGVSGSITLSSGELLVSRNLTLLGPGPSRLALNGNYVTRVLHVTNAATVFLSGFTLTNGAVSGSFPGNLGGGLWNDHSTLTVSNCVIGGNRSSSGAAGGIFNDGSSGSAKLTLLTSTVTANLGGSGGGGIYNLGSSGVATLAVTGCTISGNNGGSVNGGGIFNDTSGGNGTVSVTNSTFSSNYAVNGGGLANNAFSATSTGTVTVVNCTFSGNSASTSGGGIYNNGSSSGHAWLTVLACTFSGNSANTSSGGSIYSSFTGAKLELANTILKAASGAAGNLSVLGSFTSDGYNLCSDNGGSLLTGPQDQVNTDPLLGPLADNGGPTWTCAPLSNSPALDKGKSFGLTTDQRGAPRPFDFTSLPNASGGDGSDIGAFESGQPQLSIQSAGTSVVLSWLTAGPTFRLQTTTNLPAAATNWSTFSGTPATSGNRFYLTNSPSAPRAFYRLVNP